MIKLPEDALGLASAGYLTTQTHPSLPLTIWNYTPKCQYDKHWTPITKMCRGLVTDQDMNIVARSFDKIFNYEELEQVPNLPYVVYEKLDGSLILVFRFQGEIVVASRGSFISTQALLAREFLYDVYNSDLEDLILHNVTLCFELVGAKNRIVLRYPTDTMMVLTAGVRVDGSELGYGDLIDTMFPVCKRFAREDFASLKARNIPNEEGYIVRFDDGFRMKIKFPWYVEAHRLMTRTSTRTVWEALRQGKDITEIIEGVPDEFYGWVQETADSLSREYSRIYAGATTTFAKLWTADRKVFAQRVMNQTEFPTGLLFSLYDGRDIKDQIWKSIEPHYEKPLF